MNLHNGKHQCKKIYTTNTKGRNVDLAEHTDASYVPMKEVAQRQEISLKYLEKILPVLAKNNLIDGVHGKGGGYKLTRKPEEYTVGEILRLTEGDLAPVSCLECNAEKCSRVSECRTLPMWSKLHDIINTYLDGVTIADLMRADLCASSAEESSSTQMELGNACIL